MLSVEGNPGGGGGVEASWSASATRATGVDSTAGGASTTDGAASVGVDGGLAGGGTVTCMTRGGAGDTSPCRP